MFMYPYYVAITLPTDRKRSPNEYNIEAIHLLKTKTNRTGNIMVLVIAVFTSFIFDKDSPNT